jgi:hypothetical protein
MLGIWGFEFVWDLELGISDLALDDSQLPTGVADATQVARF